MKQLVVISGKGGTGKTTVAGALADLASREAAIVLADADVDASNLELLVAPALRETHRFLSGQVGVVDPETCQRCGTCERVCRFDAVVAPGEDDPTGAYRIDATACEGCAACLHACPEGSIRMETVQAGLWFRSDTRFGPLVHARLFAGRENSGKLVSAVRQRARELASERGAALVLLDGPPGIGCPVIAAISGADLALIVTEPTVSGEHDLDRVLGVTRHFGVPAAVAVNKADLNPRRTREIESFGARRGAALVGRMPYDPAVTDAIVRGIPLTEHPPAAAAVSSLEGIWDRLRGSLLSVPSRSTRTGADVR